MSPPAGPPFRLRSSFIYIDYMRTARRSSLSMALKEKVQARLDMYLVLLMITSLFIWYCTYPGSRLHQLYHLKIPFTGGCSEGLDFFYKIPLHDNK